MALVAPDQDTVADPFPPVADTDVGAVALGTGTSLVPVAPGDDQSDFKYAVDPVDGKACT